jgi:hypothetical protein
MEILFKMEQKDLRQSTTDILEQLDQPLLTSCAVYPFQVRDGKVFILLRQQSHQLSAFGEPIDPLDRDSSIFFTLTRSFLHHTGTLLRRDLRPTQTPEAFERVFSNYLEQGFDFFIKNPSVANEMYEAIFLENRCHTEVKGSEVVLFYPIDEAFWDMTLINETLRR